MTSCGCRDSGEARAGTEEERTFPCGNGNSLTSKRNLYGEADI